MAARSLGKSAGSPGGFPLPFEGRGLGRAVRWLEKQVLWAALLLWLLTIHVNREFTPMNANERDRLAGRGYLPELSPREWAGSGRIEPHPVAEAPQWSRVAGSRPAPTNPNSLQAGLPILLSTRPEVSALPPPIARM
jgi:hypothetical protein